MDKRPWEPDLSEKMNTEEWMKIEPVEVDIHDLIHTNQIVCDEGEDTSYSGDDHIHIVIWEGRKYISDGNNRVAKRKKRGEKIIKARVLKIENYEKNKNVI